jgi:hypothetical protein
MNIRLPKMAANILTPSAVIKSSRTISVPAVGLCLLKEF